MNPHYRSAVQNRRHQRRHARRLASFNRRVCSAIQRRQRTAQKRFPANSGQQRPSQRQQLLLPAQKRSSPPSACQSRSRGQAPPPRAESLPPQPLSESPPTPPAPSPATLPAPAAAVSPLLGPPPRCISTTPARTSRKPRPSPRPTRSRSHRSDLRPGRSAAAPSPPCKYPRIPRRRTLH